MPSINISDRAYERLRTWASVGRTLDLVLEVLLGVSTEQADTAIAELLDIRAALDDCGCACRVGKLRRD